MTISSIGAAVLRMYPQSTNTVSVAGAGFAQSLTSAAGPDAGTSAYASSGAKAGADVSAADTKLDYTHMTPRQLYAASEELLKAGKITMDEGFQMQMMARGYEWRQSQLGGSGDGNDTPVNFVAAFKDTRAFNATHGGGWSGPGCDPYTGILNIIDIGEQGGVA